MKRAFKKALSMVLLLAMLLTMIPAFAITSSAAGETTYKYVKVSTLTPGKSYIITNGGGGNATFYALSLPATVTEGTEVTSTAVNTANIADGSRLVQKASTTWEELEWTYMPATAIGMNSGTAQTKATFMFQNNKTGAYLFNPVYNDGNAQTMKVTFDPLTDEHSPYTRLVFDGAAAVNVFKSASNNTSVTANPAWATITTTNANNNGFGDPYQYLNASGNGWAGFSMATYKGVTWMIHFPAAMNQWEYFLFPTSGAHTERTTWYNTSLSGWGALSEEHTATGTINNFRTDLKAGSPAKSIYLASVIFSKNAHARVGLASYCTMRSCYGAGGYYPSHRFPYVQFIATHMGNYAFRLQSWDVDATRGVGQQYYYGWNGNNFIRNWNGNETVATPNFLTTSNVYFYEKQVDVEASSTFNAVTSDSQLENGAEYMIISSNGTSASAKYLNADNGVATPTTCSVTNGVYSGTQSDTAIWYLHKVGEYYYLMNKSNGALLYAPSLTQLGLVAQAATGDRLVHGTEMRWKANLTTGKLVAYTINNLPGEAVSSTSFGVSGSSVSNTAGNLYLYKRTYCSHTTTTTQTVAATCTTAGATNVVCTSCGTIVSSTPIAALGHSYTGTVSTTAATCTAAGNTRTYCVRYGTGGCTAYQDAAIAALGHSYGAWADCGDGANHQRVCSRDSSHIEKVAHTLSTTYTNVNATQHKQVCSVCNANVLSNHTWGAWATDGATNHKRTCTASGCSASETAAHGWSSTGTDAGNGTHTLTCTTTGCTQTTSEAHSFTVFVSTTAPTCTADGYDTYKCSKCTATTQINPTAALDHSWGAWTDNGNVSTHIRTCTRDSSHTETAPHTFGSATCDQAAACTVCGYSSGEALGHDYQNWTSNGVGANGSGTHTGTCTRDSAHTHTEDHTWDAGVQTSAPTCTDAGVTTYTCTKCSATYTQPITALGHDYSGAVTAPTCLQQGYTTYTCSRCGDTYVGDYVAATGHDVTGVNWTVIQAATSTGDGLRVKYCNNANCDGTYTWTANGQTYTGVAEYEILPMVTDATFVISQVQTTTYNGDGFADATVDVDFNLTSNPGIWGARLYIFYPGEMTLTDVDFNSGDGKTFDFAEQMIGYHGSAATYYGSYDAFREYCTANGIDPTNSSDPYYGYNVYAYELVNSANADFTTTGKLATLTFTVPSYGAYDTYPISVDCSPGDVVNFDEESLSCIFTPGEVEVTNRTSNGHTHSYGDFTDIIAATCTSDGLKAKICTTANCDMSIDKTTTTALSHNYEVVVTPPTCLLEGYTTHTCLNCGDVVVDTPTVALGHNYVKNASLSTAATAIRDGVDYFECSRGDDSYTTVLPATGQVGEDISGTIPSNNVYKLVSTMTAGKEYIIVSTNASGTGNALTSANIASGSTASVTSTSVTVNAADGTCAVPYITTANANAAYLWTTSVSNGALLVQNNSSGYYLWGRANQAELVHQNLGVTNDAFGAAFASYVNWTAGTNSLVSDGKYLYWAPTIATSNPNAAAPSGNVMRYFGFANDDGDTSFNAYIKCKSGTTLSISDYVLQFDMYMDPSISVKGSEPSILWYFSGIEIKMDEIRIGQNTVAYPQSFSWTDAWHKLRIEVYNGAFSLIIDGEAIVSNYGYTMPSNTIFESDTKSYFQFFAAETFLDNVSYTNHSGADLGTQTFNEGDLIFDADGTGFFGSVATSGYPTVSSGTSVVATDVFAAGSAGNIYFYELVDLTAPATIFETTNILANGNSFVLALAATTGSVSALLGGSSYSTGGTATINAADLYSSVQYAASPGENIIWTAKAVNGGYWLYNAATGYYLTISGSTVTVTNSAADLATSGVYWNYDSTNHKLVGTNGTDTAEIVGVYLYEKKAVSKIDLIITPEVTTTAADFAVPLAFTDTTLKTDITVPEAADKSKLTVSRIGSALAEGTVLNSIVYSTQKLAGSIGSTITLSSGTATLANGTVTYTPGDTVSAAITIYVEYLLGGLDQPMYMYTSINVVPATTVYYEDNASFITYLDGAVNGWTVLGAPDDIALDPNTVYGNSEEYVYTTYSGGSIHKITVSAADMGTDGNGRKEPAVIFTFTGTGFDVISYVAASTGLVIMEVYSGNQVDALQTALGNGQSILSGENAPLESSFIDTYYGYTYDGTAGWTQSDQGALYQVPLIKRSGYSYGTYTVILTPSYDTFFDHQATKGSYDFYVDAIRVYDPVNNDADINAKYQHDLEANPVYMNLQALLKSAGSLTGGTAVSGAVFVDGNTTVSSIDQAEAYNRFIGAGPKNEVYLSNGQGIGFTMASSEKPTKVLIGAKLAKGSTATMTVAWGENTQDFTITSATDMFYNISSVMNLADADTDISDNPIIITCTANEGNILSLTSLKWTFENAGASAGGTGSGSGEGTLSNSVMVDEATVGIVYNTIRDQLEGDEPEINPDVNGDGIVTAADLTLLRSFLASGGTILSVKPRLAADVNGDGSCDLYDVFTLKQYMIG